MRVKVWVATALVVCSPLIAHAEGFLELGIGQSKVDLGSFGAPTGVSLSRDEKDTTWTVSGGYMFHPYLGAEIGYRDLGKWSATATGPGGTARATIEIDGFVFGAIGRIPVAERFSIIPRAGFFMWDGKGVVTLNGATVSTVSDDGTDLYLGIGAQFEISKQFHIGAHFSRYDADGDGVDVIELRFGFRF